MHDILTILSENFEEYNGYDFYRYIFPANENKGELNSDFSKPNGVYLYKDFSFGKLKRRIMLNDTFEDDYCALVEGNEMTLCSGLSYRGRANTLENAQFMNALIFDIDEVGISELKNILLRTTYGPEVLRSIPMPTFIVSSGAGVHLYYVFDTPIALYPNIKVQLKALKYDLTFRFWEYKATSRLKQIQYQSINQSFRMVGSVNNKYDLPIKAFKTGNKISLERLNQYARNEKNRVDINKPFKPTKISREKAKELYPEWYERVIVNKNKNQNKWDIKGKQGFALYNWWRRQIGGIKGGHRYFYMMCLSIYAAKCDVPLSKLKEDIEEDFILLSEMDHSNALSREDIESALEAYSKEYYNYTIDDIEKLTDIRIERNKRNGRRQYVHLKIARATRDVLHENWREGNGRPKGSGTSQKTVVEWRAKNPDKRKSECIKDTGLSKSTVYKWW